MTKPLWTLRDVKRALGVPAYGADDAISGVSIDTRTLQQGDMFIALKSGGSDGHVYVKTAFEKGAACAIVEREEEGVKGHQIVVENTDDALWKLGDAQRDWGAAKRIAITGSCGKTSTKELMAAALHAHKPEASYNNHWGVPLTLARMPKEAELAVFEVGTNNPGEIARLSELVKPDVAVVTNIAPAHIGRFGSLHDIAIEKLSITQGLKTGGVLVVEKKVYDTYSAYFDHQPVTYSRTDNAADVTLDAVNVGVKSQTVIASVDGQMITFRLNVMGEHAVENALAALSVAHVLGYNLQKAAAGMEMVETPPGRGQLLEAGEMYVVDESFNANPESMRAALKSFLQRPGKGRKFAILGDMLEMGDAAAAYHEQLAPACEGLDGVVCVGEDMKHLYEALPSALQMGYFDRQDKVNIQKLQNQLEAGDMVMVKASKGIFWVRDFVPRLVEALSRPKKSQTQRRRKVA